jgi:hypothetical protein
VSVDWAELERRADGVTDLAGTPIDRGIRDVVIGLWAHGITTYFSCEGHVFAERDGVEDPAHGTFTPPRVSVEAPPPDPHPLDVEPEQAQRDLALRDQARRWRVENYRMQARLLALLERFYASRAVPFHVRLQLCPTAHEWGTCEVSSTGAQATCIVSRAAQAVRLGEYQAEMAALGRFLRDAAISGV